MLNDFARVVSLYVLVVLIKKKKLFINEFVCNLRLLCGAGF